MLFNPEFANGLHGVFKKCKSLKGKTQAFLVSFMVWIMF